MKRLATRRSAIALCIAFAISFGSMVSASRVGVILHELAGHALVLAMQGGEVGHVSVTYFGGGHVGVAKWGTPGSSRFLFDMSGIFVNGLLGAGFLAGALLVSAFAPRRRGALALAHALSWGGVLNLAGATHYACIGSYYGYGDSGPYPGVWVPSLVLLVVTMPGGIAVWSRTLAALLASRHEGDAAPHRVRLGLAGLILAVAPLAAYAVGLVAEQRLTAGRTQFATLKAESVAVAREVERIRRERVERWREKHGDRPAPREVTDVSEDDVDKPFPLLAVLLVFDALLIAGALFMPWRGRKGEAGPPGIVDWATPLGVAAVLLLVCGIVF